MEKSSKTYLENMKNILEEKDKMKIIKMDDERIFNPIKIINRDGSEEINKNKNK